MLNYAQHRLSSCATALGESQQNLKPLKGQMKIHLYISNPLPPLSSIRFEQEDLNFFSRSQLLQQRN